MDDVSRSVEALCVAAENGNEDALVALQGMLQRLATRMNRDWVIDTVREWNQARNRELAIEESERDQE